MDTRYLLRYEGPLEVKDVLDEEGDQGSERQQQHVGHAQPTLA